MEFRIRALFLLTLLLYINLKCIQADISNINTHELRLSDSHFKTSDYLSIQKRFLNTPPIFTEDLQDLSVFKCKPLSYLLPSVFDLDHDDYSIEATLNDGNPLPSWISFNSRKFKILAPKDIDEGEYNILVRITDSSGSSNNYNLLIVLSNSALNLKDIEDITLVSPQQFSLTYEDILMSSDNYDLSSKISIINLSEELIPNWISESLSQYSCLINTTFNPKITQDYNFKFEVIDYCGDPHFTNIFDLSVQPNKPPVFNKKPENYTFYKGEQSKIIPTPADMFLDPGDTLYIATANCYEANAESVKTKFNKKGNFISVNYPKSFVGSCRFPIVAKDSVDNSLSIFTKFLVSECNQFECAVCTGPKMIDCKECEILHIMNLRTGECIPILSINSLGSIKTIGIICFFYLILHFMVSSIANIFTSKKINSEIPMSIISMIQTLLIVSRIDNGINNIWRLFIDGFQYFKFELRFLNAIFFLSSSVSNESTRIPDNMYNLLFENKTAAICFCNFFIVLFPVCVFNCCKFISKLIFKSRIDTDSANYNKCECRLDRL